MPHTIDPKALLQNLLYSDENEILEFKEAKKSKFVEQIGKYVSAISNESNIAGVPYGWLCFGIADKREGKLPREIVGTSARISKDIKLEIAQKTTGGITIRNVYELEEQGKRILLMQIPAAPLGMPVAWHGKYYGRAGESLIELSMDKFDEIRAQNRYSDWSSKTDYDVSCDDLDPEAISIMKRMYARKQNNMDFLKLPDAQILSDLDLLKNGQVTNAALLLVGTRSALSKHLPHAAMKLEYRINEAEIEFARRTEYNDCFFIAIDKLWHDISMRNDSIPIQEGAYIYDIPYFNELVIREAICNAIAHRDYTIQSETIIKQYPQKITITNAGGFPRGVTINNLLTVPSTPRNRLLSDVLSKTGIVERSGQGVDKIFKYTLSEGKAAPDYSHSNEFMVELTLSAIVKDKAFAMFVKSIQQNAATGEGLSVLEIVALEKIRDDDYSHVPKEDILSLLKKGIIEKSGRTRGVKYFLSKRYYELARDTMGYINRKDEWDDSISIPLITTFLKRKGSGRIRDIEQLFGERLSRKQVKNLLKNLIEQGILCTQGQSSGTKYFLVENNQDNLANELYMRALQIGMEVIKNQIDPDAITKPEKGNGA